MVAAYRPLTHTQYSRDNAYVCVSTPIRTCYDTRCMQYKHATHTNMQRGTVQLMSGDVGRRSSDTAHLLTHTHFL